MNTLLPDPHRSAILTRLFAEAESAGDPALLNATPEERIRLMRSKTEYRELYGRLKNFWLPISPQTGALLYLLVRSTRARNVIEFGTSFGISTVYMATALRENGGGRLISTEFESVKVARARTHLVEAALDDLVEIREGDALQTLGRDLPQQVDLVLLDGAKALYSDVLDLVVDRFKPGALIVADNAGDSPEYLARVRSGNGGFVSLPFGDDVELTVYVG